MSERILLDNEYAILRFNDEHNYVHHTIKKPIHGTRLRQLLDTGLDELRRKGAAKWLSDNRLNAMLSQEDANYGLTVWGASAAEAGWKYWALVLPQSVIGVTSMRQIIEAYFNLGVTVKIFADLDEAREWLIQQ